MSRRPNPEKIDDNNPEWLEKDFKDSVTFSKLPDSLKAKLAARTRGPQKTPTKERITIRLSHDVVERFRATGDGWQTRVDAALKDWLKSHSPV
jgi:uncharacterized protein (DUF4415 family)